ncbi:hypothetical protein D3C73_1317190 [compost metagenome]
MGVKIRIAGPISMKQPTTSSNRLIISNTMIGSEEIPRIRLEIAAGRPVKAMAKDSAAEDARSSMIAPVIVAVSRRKAGSSRNGTVRCTAKASSIV